MSTPSPSDLRAVTLLLRTLGDENRLRIAALLFEGELCVCHLVGALSLSQPNVSQHLTVLKSAGLAEGERRGNWVYYRLVPPVEPALRTIFDSVLGAFRLNEAALRDRQSRSRATDKVPCS